MSFASMSPAAYRPRKQAFACVKSASLEARTRAKEYTHQTPADRPAFVSCQLAVSSGMRRSEATPQGLGEDCERFARGWRELLARANTRSQPQLEGRELRREGAQPLDHTCWR